MRTGFNTSTLAANDDGSSPQVNLGLTGPISFLGLTTSTCYVNNNGNITFSGRQSTYTPYPITTTSNSILAPFFADVDTRGSGSGLTAYGTGTVDGHLAFGATWRNVGYFSQGTNKLNSFQVVLIDRSDTGEGNFDIEFNYDRIQWEAGDASGGASGLGGFAARAGYANGHGVTYELPGSGVAGALLDSNRVTGLIRRSMNSSQLGRYVFPVRGGSVAALSPVASAGDNQDAAYNQTVVLDASATYDPRDLPLTFAWSQTAGTPVVLSDTTAVTPTFTAPATPDRLTFQLVASNADLSGTASVNISVGQIATLPASSGTGANVIFNGKVNPNGVDSTVWFEYGTDTGYGNSTATQGVGSGTDSVTFSRLSTGLLPHVTYHYRAALLQSGTTYYGSDQDFTTSTLPVILSGSASAITPFTATISASVNPNGLPTMAGFVYGSGGAGYSGTVTAVSVGAGTIAQPLSANLTGLDHSTVYHYRMFARNDSGTSYGPDQTFTTLVPPVIYSAVVTGTSIGGATIASTIYPNGVSTAVYVKYGITTSYGSKTSNLDAGSGTAAVLENITISGLPPNTLYHCKVVAIASTTPNSTVYESGDMTFTTVAATAPPTISAPGVTGLTGTSATLNVKLNPNGATNTRYAFSLGTDTTYALSGVGPVFRSGIVDLAESWNCTGLKPNTTYHWKFVVASGNGPSTSGDQTFTTLPAPGIDAVTSGSASFTGIALSGTVNPNGFATSAYFEYGTDTNYGATTTPGDAGFGLLPVPVGDNLSGLLPGTTYHWRLVASNTSGISLSPDQTFTTDAPAPLISGSVLAVSGTGVSISASVTPYGMDTNIQLDYWLAGGGIQSTTPIHSGTDSTTVTISAGPLLPGQTYHYVITTTGQAGTHSGVEQTFDTLAAPAISASATAITALSAVIAEAVNPNGTATDVVVQYGPGAGQYNVITLPISYGSLSGVISGSATLSPLTPGTTYHYRVVATGSAGTFASGDQTFSTLKSPVITLGAVTVTGTGVTVSETVNPWGTETSVHVEFGPDDQYGTSTTPQVLMGGTSAVTLNTPLGSLAAGSYHYRVVATGSAGTFASGDQIFEILQSPAITLGGVTVTGTGVTVSETVNPWGTETSVHVEFGPSVQYGTSTIPQVLSGGTSAVALNTPLGSLSAGSYHYRVVTTGSAGTFASEDQTFSTSVPSTSPVLVVSSTGATGRAVLNGGAAGYYFQYGLTTTYGSSTALNSVVPNEMPAAVSATLSGLGSGKLYHYQVVAVNGSVTSYGNDQTFATPRVKTEIIAATGDATPGLAGKLFSTFTGPALNDSGWAAYRAVISGSGVLPATNTGIWVDSGTASALLARTGNAAPGVTGGIFASLGDAALSSSARTAFYGTLTGKLISSTNNSAIWTNAFGALAKVARTGDAAAGCPAGATFASFGKLTLPKLGGPIFLANLTVGPGAVTTANNQGIWVANGVGLNKLLVRKGVPVKIGTLTKTIKTLSAFTTPTGQGRQFSDTGTLVCLAAYTDGTQSILKVSKLGVLTAVAWNKNLAPQIASSVFISFGNPVIDSTDFTAFQATVAGAGVSTTNNSGIWADAGKGLALVTRTGTTSPGVAGLFSTLSDPVSNKNHRVAFSGRLNNGVSGIWTNATGSVQLVARSQGAAADCPAGTTFSTFRRFTLPDQGGVVFLADLTIGPGVSIANNQGLWAVDTTNHLHLVVRKGDQLTVDGTVKTITALNAFVSTAEVAGQPGSTNSAGNLVYTAIFADGTQAILGVTLR